MNPGWKTTEHWMTWSLHGLTALLAAGVLHPGTRWAAVASLLTSGMAQWKYTSARAAAKARAPLPRSVAAPNLPKLIPYRAGTRRSRHTGEIVFVFEFKAARTGPPKEEPVMFDTVAQFVTPILLKLAHERDKNHRLSPEFDLKVTRSVTDVLNVVGDALQILGEMHAATKK